MTLVTAVGVSLAYGRHQALAPSDFSVPSGGITVLIGPNGSGKSTVLAALAGLHEPVAGSLTWSAGRRPSLSFVLQATKVNEALPVTAREVVMMGRYGRTGAFGRFTSADHEAVDAAMERMAISDLADRHLRELSGGQRQRVFVAQGLAQPHDVLLLDEPLTGLDIPSTTAIDRVIHEEVGHGCSVVLTSHDLDEARAADHVILLAGRVVASGRPDDALAPGHLAEAYGRSPHADPNAPVLDDPIHRPVDTPRSGRRS